MKKLLLGLTALFALSVAAPAFAGEDKAPAEEKAKDTKKDGKKGGKKEGGEKKEGAESK